MEFIKSKVVYDYRVEYRYIDLSVFRGRYGT